MDEMWDATDTVTFEGLPFMTETTYTAMDLAPETSVFVRVAAAAGSLEAPLMSAFTTHVSAMSAMPPPEPLSEPELRWTRSWSRSRFRRTQRTRTS